LIQQLSRYHTDLGDRLPQGGDYFMVLTGITYNERQ
jgi:hypothetical protein